VKDKWCALCGFTIEGDDDCKFYPGTGWVCSSCLENSPERENPVNYLKREEEMFGFELLLKRGYD
jgi:hypothetical protein